MIILCVGVIACIAGAACVAAVVNPWIIFSFTALWWVSCGVMFFALLGFSGFS